MYSLNMEIDSEKTITIKKQEKPVTSLKKKHKVNVENLLQVLAMYGMKKPTPSPPQ